MIQVEMSNMYIDMSVNDGSEKWTGKNTAASDMVIKRYMFRMFMFICYVQGSQVS